MTSHHIPVQIDERWEAMIEAGAKALAAGILETLERQGLWIKTPHADLPPEDLIERAAELARREAARVVYSALAVGGTTKLTRLYAAQERLCFYCNEPMAPVSWRMDRTNGWTRDHLVPRSRNGTGEDGNVVLAHKRCNAMKGDRWPTPDERARCRALYVRMNP